MPRRQDRPRWVCTVAIAAVVVSLVAACSSQASGVDSPTGPSTAEPTSADVILSAEDHVVARLDPRFQSYNIEMVEVTGGQFWSPYDAGEARVARPPLDLASTRLRNLAAALGPVYIRVSGTWANRTYFDVDGTTGGVPPEGFGSVLTTDQWRGVGAFADAVDGEILTSFASVDPVRDAGGAWMPDQARALLAFSRDNDVPVRAAELFNEPNLGVGLPPGYDAAAFARDLTTFQELVDDEMPDLLVVGPGTTGDFRPMVVQPRFTTEGLLGLTGPIFDAFSYHAYPKVSERCASQEGPEIALSEDYLTRVPADRDGYRDLRDRFVPGAPMWITETAQASCGGDRWAATARDVVRYVDTLGRLGDGDGDVVFHNTLAASDYGLIGEDGFVPRPDYWAAVLWARLMGSTVLAPGATTGVDGLSVYAHCAVSGAGQAGVTYAVVNSSADQTRTVTTGSGQATAYVLSSDDLDSSTIDLNGTELRAGDDGTLPSIEGREVTGAVEVPPASVAFVVDPSAPAACT